jgi:Uma2 family endonuclease
MASQPTTFVTPEQYLEFERAAETKHQYFLGEIFDMAGGSPVHALLTANISGELRGRLLSGKCRVYSPDLRVSAGRELITYPDVAIVCGPLQFADQRRDTVTNPIFLAEVLSPSTRAFDRGEKSRLYRTIPSLAEYLLVDQQPVDVEHWRRLPNGNWELATIRDRGAVVRLESLGCELPVEEIYRDVESIES